MLSRNQRRPRRRAGFTLLEVLLVMAILIILASVVTISYSTIQRNSQSDKAAMDINALEQACEAYRLDVGTLPNNLSDLVASPQGVNRWRGPYLKDPQLPKDPWGGDYQYNVTTDVNNLQQPIISSAGPDRSPNSGDDITNAKQAQ